MDYREIAYQMEKIAKGAGQLIKQKEACEISEKKDAANLVTNMDIASQRYIIERCSKLIPDSRFFAEEEGRQELGETYTWVIDPIDGTTNYAYDYRHSCISIALLYKKKGIIGVIYDPYLDECFVGVDGEPSTCNGKVIHAADHDLKHALIMLGTSPYNKKLADKTFDSAKKLFLQGRDIRRSGSAALDICYVACGRVDAFYEAQLSLWDYAAGYVIAVNAQVKASGLHQNEMDDVASMGVLFANPVCFDEVKRIVGD